MKKRAVLLPIILLSLCSCSDTQPITEYLYLFDTVVDVRLYDGKQENLDDLTALLTKLDYLFDAYQSHADMVNIYSLNQTNETKEVDPLLSEYLSGCLEIQNKTEGYINPLVGNLTSLWKTDLDAGKLPAEEEITACLKDMESSSLKVVGNQVTRNGQATIDAGALAKGFALKKAQEYLSEHQLKQYMISAGGSSILLGEKPGNGGFKVSLRDISGSMELENTTISTSSIYQQQWTLDGKTYSHLINPFTGKNEVINSYAMAIGEDPFLLDGYSTMFTLRSKEECLDYESDCKEVLYDGSDIIYQSEGLEISR